MLAAVFHGLKDIRIEEVEQPAVGPDEALLKVRAATICGTDLRTYASGHHQVGGARRIFGHEVAGDVVAVGAAATGLKVGQKIAVAPNAGCGCCWQCIQGNNHLCDSLVSLGMNVDGAFAEYMRVPARYIRGGNAVEIPEGVTYAEAALVEPCSCVYNGISAVRIEPGDVVAIIGAGPIGIMHLLMARLSGARRVIISEMSEERLEQALTFGADLTVNPESRDVAEAVREVSGGQGANVVIVAAPSPDAQMQALELIAARGRINFFGGLPRGNEFIRFNSNLIHYKEVMVTGTSGSNNYQYRRTMEIVASGRIKLEPLLSARFPLARVDEAFALAASRKALKVAVEA